MQIFIQLIWHIASRNFRNFLLGTSNCWFIPAQSPTWHFFLITPFGRIWIAWDLEQQAMYFIIDGGGTYVVPCCKKKILKEWHPFLNRKIPSWLVVPCSVQFFLQLIRSEKPAENVYTLFLSFNWSFWKLRNHRSSRPNKKIAWLSISLSILDFTF